MYQLYGLRGVGVMMMMAKVQAPTNRPKHRRRIAPGREGGWGTNKRLSRLTSDAVWQFRSIGRIWACPCPAHAAG